MITDQLRRDNLSWIETHKTTDCLFRSHSQFFCTLFLPVVPDTYTGMHPTRAVRVWNSSLRLWKKMWITHSVVLIRTKSSRVGRDVAVSCKKKHYYSSIQTVAHWYVWLLTLVYSLLYMYILNFGSMFCCCCCCCCLFSNLHRVQLLVVTSM